jgi:hypothetical protein
LELTRLREGGLRHGNPCGTILLPPWMAQLEVSAPWGMENIHLRDGPVWCLSLSGVKRLSYSRAGWLRPEQKRGMSTQHIRI